MPKPCAPADGLAGPQLEAPVGPADRARLGGVEKAEQRERGQLRPPRRRHQQPQHDPERDDLVPDDRARVGDAQVARGDRAGPPAEQQRRRRSATPSRARRASGRAATKASQAHSVPTVPGARGDSPLPKPSAIQCAGCSAMKAALARRGGAHAREVVEAGRAAFAAPNRRRAAAAAATRPASRPMRLTRTPAASAAACTASCCARRRGEQQFVVVAAGSTHSRCSASGCAASTALRGSASPVQARADAGAARISWPRSPSRPSLRSIALRAMPRSALAERDARLRQFHRHAHRIEVGRRRARACRGRLPAPAARRRACR